MDSSTPDELLIWGNHFYEKIMNNERYESLIPLTENWLRDLEYHVELQDPSPNNSLYIRAAELYNEWRAIRRESVPIGGHTLPPLPYAYDALEPYISARIMKLHHDKHHQSYVDGLNQAETELEKARKKGKYELIKHWERELAFNGAGHYLHTIFWKVMTPHGGKPSGVLLDEINKSFGSFKQFKEQFTNAANKVEGSGWAILVWSPVSRRLEILQAEKHQNLSQWDVIPLLVLDVWEHAYYLQYENNRKEYIDNWWNVVNWLEVTHRLETAQLVKWESF
ncbi:superoxide dismutase [Alkalihalobacillus sp. CinArs1]|uniref:superoxide dismutase n=1 Tax=Alkalihalobacillus sp. CinArs1 TaxID=2995314 RepID=UPI0022DE07D6|nr:superoxide dismutase [Alkalihalobacillus sp. CinArs1]